MMFKIEAACDNNNKQFLPLIGKKYRMKKYKNSEQNIFRYRIPRSHSRQAPPSEIPELIRDYYSKYHQTIKKSAQPLSVSINFRDVSEKQLETSVIKNKIEKMKKNKQKNFTQPSTIEFQKPFFTPDRKKKREGKSNKAINYNILNLSRSIQISQVEPSKDLISIIEEMSRSDHDLRCQQIIEYQSSQFVKHQQFCLRKINLMKDSMKDYSKNQNSRNQSQRYLKNKRSLRPKKSFRNNTQTNKNCEDQKYLSPWVIQHRDYQQQFASKQASTLDV